MWGWRVPEELQGLELYEKDKRLCERWAKVYPMWVEAYPILDIMACVRSAHAWEVEHSGRRKTRRAQYIGGWLRRQADRDSDTSLRRAELGLRAPPPKDAQWD